MCGIAGLIGPGDPGDAVARVQAMVDRLARRGPDDEGLEQWPAATLGHRRLAVFDVSAAGHQPMTTPDGQLGVVFNGAVYNWPSLRDELAATGVTFASATDTEVLLHGYRAWGIDGLVSRCRGMFAFGIWDQGARTLFLVRDRLGVKPLVYSERDGRIAFASTPTALEAAGFTGPLDPVAVGEFLEFGVVPERSCIFRGVAKLPPATILEWTDGRSSTRRYWSLPSAANGRPRPFDEVVEETEARFLEAVSIRQFADVPVAALLSGGVDSSLVCWALAEAGANVAAFTVGTPGDEADETSDAVATARALGLDHRVIAMDQALTPDLSDLIAAYPEPFGCSSALGMLAVSRAIRPHATVVLTGDGGDDAFLGYRRHRYLWLAQRYARRIPAPVLSVWRALAPRSRRGGLARRGVQFLDVVAGGLGAYMRAQVGLPDFASAGWLGDRLADVPIPERELDRTTGAARTVLSRFLELHRREKLVAEYLTKVDGATMHHALEARSPFMDQELWEHAYALPPSVHLHGSELKAVLRAIARKRLGDRVAEGRKRGFTIPVEAWLAGRWRKTLEEALEEPILEREGFVRPEPLRKELTAAEPGGPLPTHFWYYTVLETWMRLREGSPAPAAAAA